MEINLSCFPAAIVVHTPNGATPACERHAQAIKTIFGVLGSHTNTTPLDGFAPCQNCVNEYLKNRRKST